MSYQKQHVELSEPAYDCSDAIIVTNSYRFFHQKKKYSTVLLCASLVLACMIMLAYFLDRSTIPFDKVVGSSILGKSIITLYQSNPKSNTDNHSFLKKLSSPKEAESAYPPPWLYPYDWSKYYYHDGKKFLIGGGKECPKSKPPVGPCQTGEPFGFGIDVGVVEKTVSPTFVSSDEATEVSLETIPPSFVNSDEATALN